MQEQMGAKRKLDEAMMDKVVGTSRTLPITHFTREFVLDSQGAGWTGVLLLADGKATFTQDQTTFVRVRSPRVAFRVAIPSPSTPSPSHRRFCSRRLNCPTSTTTASMARLLSFVSITRARCCRHGESATSTSSWPGSRRPQKLMSQMDWA